ncbi:MAG: flagellar filament capping protein FliD [Myxococcales bacterium]
MTISSNYNAAGLASNIDWSVMIDGLVKNESMPLTLLKNQQSALKTQVSTLGTLASKLAALKTATDALADSGAVSVSASSNTSFSAAPGSGATAGRFSFQVETLARAGKQRSQGYGAGDSLAPGTLTLTSMGKQYTVDLSGTESLSDVAAKLRATGAPVSANVLSDGTKSYLVVTNRDTGHPLTGTPADGLSIDSGSTGLAFASLQDPVNAVVHLDGVKLTRTSNTITDAIADTALTLKTEGGPAEDLVLSPSATDTATNLQKFVDAYNAVLKVVQSQLAVSEGTDRETTLAGDSAVRSLQGALQRTLVTSVGGTDVRTLADIGIKTARDGSISLDQGVLTKALARSPEAINTLFADATSGVGKTMAALADTYTNSTKGLLVLRQTSLNKRVEDLDQRMEDLQARLEKYRQNLIARFTAMENVISGLKATGNYLTQQENAKKSSSS